MEAQATLQMPAVFLGHGSPMNTLETNRFTQAWRTIGAGVPRPRAILCVSAHWFVPVTAVTAMPRPRTIHDFYGFPQELFEVQYPAPGDTQLAEEIAELVKPHHVGLDHDSWGLDHGTWSVLVHAFPKADVPVVQLSINTQRPVEYHLELGAKLAALRERGILILGSGNVVHNLRLLDWSTPDAGYDWAERFNDASRKLLTENPGDLPRLVEHPDFRKAVPTPDHFLPVAYLAGLAAAAGRPLDVLVDGHAFGSISMACYGLGVEVPAREGDSRPSAEVPSKVPGDQTNI